MKNSILLIAFLIFNCFCGLLRSSNEGRTGQYGCASSLRSAGLRPHSVTITEFGAVGDGVTLNTHAFQNAIFYIHSFADKGGGQLYVPAGRWLTGSFNLTSHLTLFLDKDAVILGSQEPKNWPVVDPLPSYGRGRELPGGRHISLIFGVDLTDVVITGDNGTIDGQGAVWWTLYQNKSLDYSRGHLIELINSKDVVISNLTFLNSPSWTIHPVYCSNVLIQNVTVLAPHDAPNTDGIDPDSSSDVCIEDCFISNGGNAISIKSGWDEYGVSYGQPSLNIEIRRVVVDTYSSAGISFGSEMSGGISEVYVEDVLIHNAATGILLATSSGRGGFMREIYISDILIVNADVAIELTGFSNDHPDDKYDPGLLPSVQKIAFQNIIGKNISLAGRFKGLSEAPFQDLCLQNVTLNITSQGKSAWECSYVQGSSESVFPMPCPQLQTPNCSYTFSLKADSFSSS